MPANGRPLIAITMGDPAGIGPEVTAKALIDCLMYERCRPVVIGSPAAIEATLHQSVPTVLVRTVRSLDEVEGDPGTIDILDTGKLDYGAIVPGQVSAEAGRASIEWVLKAGEMASMGQVQAVVTAPINKEAGKLAGYKDVGQPVRRPTPASG